jgi:hypothetical protein
LKAAPKSTLPFACAAAIAAAQCFAGVSAAAPVQRLKAKLIAFDGQAMTLEPLSSAPPARAPNIKAQGAAAASAPPVDDAAKPFTVAVLPGTRYVGSDKASFAAIKEGDYVGAAVTQRSGGKLRAQNVYLYAEALRGTGEGRFPEGERLLVNGTVSEVKPTAPEDQQDGFLTLHYRGAVLTGLGRGRTLCEGRASPPAYASALACEASVAIEVMPGTPVFLLTVGDKSLLIPGSLVTVTMTRANDDKNITPGVIVEKLVTVEKPQPAP